MKVSLEWIQEYVDLNDVVKSLSPKELMSKVTLATCEVEEVLESGGHWEQIVVAQIKSLKKHPDSDKLNLVTFEYGKDGKSKTKEVVCGAPNVREGIKVPYAALGTKLPNGMVLEAKAIRGIMSEGMLCSKDELGMGGEHSGLWEMPSDAPIGETLLKYLKEHKDIVLDIDNKSLTHRPDLWGIYGMAREFAAIWKKELKNPFQYKIPLKKGEASPVLVRAEGESSCLSYFGLSLEGISVKNDSPSWMKRRLIASGLRPINNIVDISNYVMLELGIPNHIFDADEIKEEIILKRLGKKEKFVTLDGIERELLEHDTVVADTSGPLVIAGVMGGLKSGVTEKTKRIFLEVANWKAGEVRKTSSRLGLRTDSSQRYEKALDSRLLERSMARLVELLLQDMPEAKVVGQLEYAGASLEHYSALKIETSYSFIRSRLGKDISNDEISSIFKALDFKVDENVRVGSEESEDKIMVTVPSYRATKDIENREDLVEEIGRMLGFDNIVPVSPLGGISPVRLSPAKQLHRKIQDFMVMIGKSHEVYSYPMLGEALLKRSKWPELNENFVLTNALSVDHDRMRPSLVPSLLDSIALNVKYHDSFRFFELGRAYGISSMNGELKAKPHEGSQLGVVHYCKNSSSQELFMELVGLIENLLKTLKIPHEISLDHPRFKNTVLPRDWKGSHPFEFYHIQVMGKVVGGISTIHPLLLRDFKVKSGHAVMAVIDLSSFEEKEIKEKNAYKALPKFPSVTFDCTVMADAKVPVLDILSSMKKLKLKEYKESKVLTVFPMGDKKAVTLRSLFADEERTLPADLIKELENKVISTLGQAGYALKV